MPRHPLPKNGRARKTQPFCRIVAVIPPDLMAKVRALCSVKNVTQATLLRAGIVAVLAPFYDGEVLTLTRDGKPPTKRARTHARRAMCAPNDPDPRTCGPAATP
jgi:hypothetical protein